MTDLIKFFENSEFCNPIGNIKPMGDWKSLDINESNEELVPLGAFSEYTDIYTDAIYFAETNSSPYSHGDLEGALITCFVRETVAEKLREASKLLPDGYAIMVWDSYRPLEVQNTLYKDFVDELKAKRNMTQEEAELFAPNFVNMATDDPSRPSPHHTGGSIDLTIIKFDDDVKDKLSKLNKQVRSDDWKVSYAAEMARQALFKKHATPIDVGAKFDEASEASAVKFFEDRIAEGEKLLDKEYEQAMNRRILQNILRSVGFTSFEPEWWHVDYGNQFYSAQSGEPAQYSAVKLSEENIEHETMRRQHYIGTHNLSKATPGMKGKLGDDFADQPEALIVAKEHADVNIRHSKHPIAGKLEV
ncbi:MAG: hypothetical protein CMH28_01255 [Micavibrio sp.]|nr:hypothetical protein [Micavibrio sp.]|tara:strand:- start:268 stop:1347 length:1080 start_codon:yes stop_codon:yes gene_type:complete